MASNDLDVGASLLFHGKGLMKRQLPTDLTAKPDGKGTADNWGRVMARGQGIGRPVGAMGAFIAATAKRYDLALVTRNVADFAALGVRLINPWRTG